jgi:hypothetical protein
MIQVENLIILSAADYAQKSVRANDVRFNSDAAKDAFMLVDWQMRERLETAGIYRHKYVFMNDKNGRKVAIAVISADTLEHTCTAGVSKPYPAFFHLKPLHCRL